MKEIYLDNSATTPVEPAVFAKMKPYFSQKYGNASSTHRLGEESRRAVEAARRQVADFLGCLLEEVYFTSGATESDNWAVFGVAEKVILKGTGKPHLITSAVEHKAVLEPCQILAKRGRVRLTILPVSKDGLVEVKELEKSITKDTVLVSVMLANSEIGTIQPIKEIGQLLKKLNAKRKEKIYFHTDAVQAANYLNCKVDDLGVDLLSLSGHKIYGPKGVGILYVRKGTAISPLVYGGGHEKGMRSGTENVTGIVGLGEAVKRISPAKAAKVKKLRNKLITGILKDIPDVILNGSLEKRLPNNAHFSFIGAEGEAIAFDLSRKGVCVSTGSACASHSLEPSYVLMAIGMTPEQSHASVRFTLGKQTTAAEINYVLRILPPIVARLRKIAGYKGLALNF